MVCIDKNMISSAILSLGTSEFFKDNKIARASSVRVICSFWKNL